MQPQRIEERVDQDSEDAEGRGEDTPTAEGRRQAESNGTEPARETHSRLWKLFRVHFIEPLIGSTNPPWFDARGIAVGLAVGFGVPVGAQLAVMGVLRAVFRYNTVVAFAFSWVNNPFTMIPMYYGYYYLGSLILDRPVALTGEMFREVMAPIVHADHFLQSIHQFMYLGCDILLRWGVTSFILATSSAVLGYVVGLRVQRAHCRRKAAHMGVTYDKLLAKMEQAMPRAHDRKR
ncbi:MAG: DUF2062 domain-containing protein [Desulfomonilaceae bacterium]|nr:DUF2062 domain-containing protein [Desulfomonilaceae bacterium]